ncbi:hypothetical protein [Streptomyces sp. NPDC002913]
MGRSHGERTERAARRRHGRDAVLRLPVMDCARAREELGWQPRYSASDVLTAFPRGAVRGRGEETAPLAGSRRS